MSVNTAHTSNGLLLHAGEFILLHCKCISLQFLDQDSLTFHGNKCGHIFLTSHRLIFNNKKRGDDMQSFSAPFISLSELDLEQPPFGPNYIKGKVTAQPNGNFKGQVRFKMYFKAGGAIEFGRALKCATDSAKRDIANDFPSDHPPPYAPFNSWYEAPLLSYEAPKGYSDWLPTHEAFSEPMSNTVYVGDLPPPYQGIGEPPMCSSTATPQSALNDDKEKEQQGGYNRTEAPPSYHSCACKGMEYRMQLDTK